MDYRKYESKRFWLHLITTPFIWLPFPFVVLLDLACSTYQLICFPVYKLEKVKRSEYILIFDRNKLQYLDGLEKLGCMYCGYVNGATRYFKEIAGRTEKYWCGIMHENKPGFKVQEDQAAQGFAKFGDEKECEEKYGRNTGN